MDRAKYPLLFEDTVRRFNKYADRTRLTLVTSDASYVSVIVRRKGYNFVLSTSPLGTYYLGEDDCKRFPFYSIIREQSEEDGKLYRSMTPIDYEGYSLEKLLRPVTEIKLLDSLKVNNILGLHYSESMVTIPIPKYSIDKMKEVFNWLHKLPHETPVKIIDINGFNYPAIVYKTPHRHVLLTNAMVLPRVIFENMEDIKNEYGANNYIGIGCYIFDQFSQDCTFIDSVSIPEEYLEMNPKDLLSGPIQEPQYMASVKIKLEVKKMSKLVVKDIVIKDISEAALRRYSAAIVADLGYSIDTENKSLMWNCIPEIDLTEVPVNVTPASIKNLFLEKIKEEPEQDSKWMVTLAKYNLIQSVTLVEKNGKG